MRSKRRRERIKINVLYAIIEIEPFHTLIYGDDSLSWGDEALTREIYEKAFAYYT